MHNSYNVAIIDYEMGNIFSVKRACLEVGLQPVVTSSPQVILRADGIILPGVGAFGDAMENLRVRDLITPIKEGVRQGIPFLGICLGMQLIFTESEEFGSHKGLDLLPGVVVKFPPYTAAANHIKVPQVGWNSIELPRKREISFWRESPLSGIEVGDYMYFVHSYYTIPNDDNVVLSNSHYEGTQFCSSILHKNIFACQFHPEKSGRKGIEIYDNWLKSIIKHKGLH
ncbi:MAG: hypothetical protein AMJ61_04460 [Desulfobacterales bacterium SG8_35_2]|nr:MAG: hypothetical protein AMJ61_04460 [Desulfobacterales bacterium SG8_35_2]